MVVDRQRLAELIAALNDAEVRYLVVGGLAVIAHGYIRATADCDIVLDLTEANALAAIRVLTSLGYQPRVPVPAESFADATIRERWITEKHMTVFSMFHPRPGWPVVDLFATMPFEYEVESRSLIWSAIAPGVRMPVVALPALLEMKRAVGRPRDVGDIQELLKLEKGARDDS